MSITKEKQKNAFDALKADFKYTNLWQAPRLEKVVVSVGAGTASKDKKKMELIENRLAKFTGQKPVSRKAKKSIAVFKLREGEKIGFQVSLRGNRMFGFLDKLVYVALPRTKDFRGLPLSSIDGMGNCTLGIKEHIIFPETSDEELRNVFGLAITIVSSAKTKAEAEAFLRHLGFPFKNEAEKKKRKRKARK